MPEETRIRLFEVEVEAGVRVRALRSGAMFAQRYRLRLERRERWYVADVNTSRER